jgi:polyketide cyclase/dehydrase/lipid transport protein
MPPAAKAAPTAFSNVSSGSAGAKKPAGQPVRKTVDKRKGKRQKISETIQIDAPPAKVWATIADFHDMSWLPGVAKTSGEGGNEADAAKRRFSIFRRSSR